MIDDLKHWNSKQDYLYVLKVESIGLDIYDGENANRNKYAIVHIDIKSWKILYYERVEP